MSETEELVKCVARLHDEVHRLTNRVNRLEARGAWMHRLKRWLKGWLGIRLGVFEQYSPRPIRLPRRYAGLASNTASLPVLSIVTPAFNHARFLERTLRSVLEQDYPRLEYVVQDGGSHDETPALLERYAGRLTHTESAPDRGQAHALNLGFAHTSGEVMAYLNSDDLLLPGCLHYVASYFAAHPKVDVVYGHRILIDVEDLEIGRWVLPPHADSMLVWADYVPQETLFWRRRIWDRAGGAMDETFQFALDWDLLLRFRAAGAEMVRLPRFLGAFRIHDAQKSQAQLDDIGEKEMARLRQRVHGRAVTWTEIRQNLRDYVARHILYDHLYRWGLWRC